MNTNKDLHTPYSTVLFRMTSSDIFNDTKRCAVSLRQPSYLFLLLSDISLKCYQLLPDVSVLNCHYISFE